MCLSTSRPLCRCWLLLVCGSFLRTYSRCGAYRGYAGGSSSNPTYKAVSSGRSDHVEVVQVHYDPSQVSLRELIDFFWTTHDVSDGRGVYPDYGPQYRSLLLYQNAAQKAIIEASRSAYIAQTSKQVATELKQLDTFYTAEAYHQDFAKKHPQHPYIQGILVPKLKKLGFHSSELTLGSQRSQERPSILCQQITDGRHNSIYAGFPRPS